MCEDEHGVNQALAGSSLIKGELIRSSITIFGQLQQFVCRPLNSYPTENLLASRSQTFLNDGTRFSMNALMPSAQSSRLKTE